MIQGTTHTVEPVEGHTSRNQVNCVDLRPCVYVPSPVNRKRSVRPRVEADEVPTVDVDDESLEEGLMLVECAGPSAVESLTMIETDAEEEMSSRGIVF